MNLSIIRQQRLNQSALINELNEVQKQGQTNSGQSVQKNNEQVTSYQPASTSTNNMVHSHTVNRQSIGLMKNPPATQISKTIGPKPEYPAPKPIQHEAAHSANTKIETFPKEKPEEITQRGTNAEKGSTATDGVQHEAKTEVNQDLVNNLNKITGSFKYKMTRSSSKRREMVLNALTTETGNTISNDTLKAILSDKNCSRGVKTALLLSDNVSLAQKQEILKEDTSGDILAYAKRHNILNEVRWGITIGDKEYKDTQIKVDNTLERIIDTALFDTNGRFTLTNEIQNFRDFFTPDTFTTKERQEIVEQLEIKENSANGSDKALIRTMISCFESDTTLDSVVKLSKQITDENRTSIDELRTPETFVKALFSKNEQFTIPDNIQADRDFFNPSTFTKEEREKIVKQLEAKKTQNPQTDDATFNNLKIDTAILMFSNDNVEKKCKNFNAIFNTIMQKMESFVNDLPDTMNDDTKNKAEKIKHNCKGIAATINTFHSQAPKGHALNTLWNANAVQGITRILMPLDEIVKKENGASISGAKKEALKRAKEQPTIQKAKYEVCKHFDNLSDTEKKTFGANNKFYTFDTTGLELKHLCHKDNEEIKTTATTQIDVFNLNDTAMHQVATKLGLLKENEKFNIDEHTVKYGQQPILIGGKKATAQEIIEIVKSGKVNETKVTVTQVKRNDNGSPVIEDGKQVREQVEKTLAELLQQ